MSIHSITDPDQIVHSELSRALCVCCQLLPTQRSRQHTVAVTRLRIVHRGQLVLCELVLVLLMRALERLVVSRCDTYGAVRLTATQARIDVEIGAGSDTRGANTSASSFGMNFGTVYGNASTLSCQYCIRRTRLDLQRRRAENGSVELYQL